jgi:bifunctional UDP-N-acetylglucosamine pyrophosphorylase/glucosamine-1-phosphate N-acetyltransferase
LNADICVTESLVDALVREQTRAIAVRPVDGPTSYGVVDTAGSSVTNIVEKPSVPPTNLANLDLYRFTPEISEYIDQTELSERGKYEITDSILFALDDGHPISVVGHDDPWLDIVRPWELLSATEHLLADVERDVRGDVEPDATLKSPVVVGDRARLKPGVRWWILDVESSASAIESKRI